MESPFWTGSGRVSGDGVSWVDEGMIRSAACRGTRGFGNTSVRSLNRSVTSEKQASCRVVILMQIFKVRARECSTDNTDWAHICTCCAHGMHPKIGFAPHESNHTPQVGKIAPKLHPMKEVSPRGQTDGQMDGHYQTYYLPASQSIITRGQIITRGI